MGTLQYEDHPGVKADPANLPQHIAVIMDGNGRWARSRGISHTKGHQQGVEVARDIIFACQEKEIKVLTLFAFGIENWKRPPKEVRNLFRIFFLVLRREIARFDENKIKLRVIGDRSIFTPGLQSAISAAEKRTQDNPGLVLNIAVNYSGRWDLLQGIQKLLSAPASARAAFSEAALHQQLSLHGLPEPDLFIRTGGVQRISNFMLWELAYTELFFTPVLWPDFSRQALERALADYALRERRFGLTSEQLR